MHSVKKTIRTAIGISVLAASLAANAGWPDKPVRFIVPYPPGGAADLVTRLMAQKLSADWGQPVVVENKPGADTQIGAEYVAKSAPDGYTIGSFAPAIVVNRFLFPNANYDLNRDLQPVAGVYSTPAALVVSASSEAKTLKDFVAMARRKPDGLTFATASSSGYIGIESFNRAAGIKARQIPYKGSVSSISAVVTGEVTYTMDTIPNVQQLVNSGRLRMLGVTSKERLPDMPDMPVVGEAAPGFDFTGWIILIAPAATPSDVVAKINSSMLKALALPEVKAKLESLGSMPLALTPETLRALLKSEIAKYGDVIATSDFTGRN
ncbi:Argininosuccinate lyase [Variovorax sp. PBL-H6]|uniref:Bug family tripartite tricarboxylate transporter substrate binding protein n=1 Tax=Variovorax sp. PBL-H6 TaxID=434009 RepID=UPI001319936E|nr:tripartite tricarboxylate transporter substrate-binding protein [Variovorax sp. PBL-H6]VTU33475.1 Argininosuccinate lyase [Variovorax sp. PBL-H6]